MTVLFSKYEESGGVSVPPFSYRLLLRVVFAALILLVLSTFSEGSQAQSRDFTQATKSLTKQSGFIPFYWDADAGKVLMELTEFDSDVLYYVSAATGAGSVELPLDRGILKSMVVHFHKSGPNVLVIQQNLDFRAQGGTPERVNNVDLSFATSVLASLPVISKLDKTYLVDATALFIRDAADVENGRASKHAQFKFDNKKSGFYPARMKNFTDNTEIETIASFNVSKPNVVVKNVLPDSRVLSMRIHHSFLRAPTGYETRQADSRIGVSKLKFSNLANPINKDTEVSWVTRWRLEKKQPQAAMSEAVKPIVFYLDPAIPDDIRQAMKEGTLWWNEAFETAGFKDAVQVKDPEPDMDPMDIRYAWVQWIERDGRGFSMGGTYRDPRTGEILGSKSRLDSHRMRTVASYYKSYVKAATADGKKLAAAEIEFALARQRVLVAHELGHVLGFGHNWASSINDRASVMEYPSPRVKVKDGKLDLSEAFAVGIGEYDKYMVRYAYTPMTKSAEAEGLNSIIEEMHDEGILFVPSTDPRWAWYDDLSSPSKYMDESFEAREIMLAQYGPDMLQEGEPLGHLRDMKLWMVYLHHRWAIEAAQRFIGGMYHEWAVKGDGLTPTQIVPKALQDQLLSKLMHSLSPDALALPEALLVQLTVHPGLNREDMSDDYAFDQLKAARILADLIVTPLLEPKKLSRMVAFEARDPATLTLPQLIETLVQQTWGKKIGKPSGRSALLRVTQSVVLNSLMTAGADVKSSPEVTAMIMMTLSDLAEEIEDKRHQDPLTKAHYQQAYRSIQLYLSDPIKYVPSRESLRWGDQPMSRYPAPPGPPL